MNRPIGQEKRSAVREIKRACTEPKSELIRLQRRLMDISPRDARALGAVIARLEAWQNRP